MKTIVKGILVLAMLFHSASTETNDMPWNLPDVSAVVGRAFQYHVGLKEHPVKFKILEIGEEHLPNWLTYNDVSDSIEGIPIDVGEYNIAVIPEDGPKSKHFFTINVYPDPLLPNFDESSEANDLDPDVNSKCKLNDPQTRASVVVDAEHDKLNGTEKVALVDKFVNYLKIGRDVLRLQPLADKAAYDRSALVAGPGNAREQRHSGVVLSWHIGCGSVDKPSMTLLEFVEASAADGSMTDAVGHPIIGWHVTNKQPRVKLTRRKRNVAASPALHDSKPTKYELDVDDEQNDSPSRKKHRYKRTKTAGRHLHLKTKHAIRPTRRRLHPRSLAGSPAIVPIKPTPLYEIKETDLTRPDIRPTPTDEMMMTPTVTVTHSGSGELRPDGANLGTLQPSMSIDTRRNEVRPTPPVDNIRPTDSQCNPSNSEHDEPPYVRNPIGRITAYVGEVLHYKIPKDTFRDKEDGDTSKLKVFLLERDKTLTPVSWIQIDMKRQVLYGLPLEDQARKRRYTYKLKAVDSSCHQNSTDFEVIVKKFKKQRKITHEFTMVINTPYNLFMARVDNPVSVAEKIAKVFGDKDGRFISVTSIKEGSVLFSWTNNSLSSNTCPKDELDTLCSYIFEPGRVLNQRFLEIMKPYSIKTAKVVARNACEGEKEFAPKSPTSGQNPIITIVEKVDQDNERETSNDSMMITTIIPCAIIGGLIIIAAIIACVLYRASRKGRLSDEDKNTFTKKGIPVIFADEIEEKPDPPTRPLIMEDEKPPLPPPEYNRTNPRTARTNGAPHQFTSTPRNPNDGRQYRPPPNPRYDDGGIEQYDPYAGGDGSPAYNQAPQQPGGPRRYQQPRGYNQSNRYQQH